ncbi:hypothetical protein JRC04_04675 [Mycolicibacterium sp. S2-37]|uniref:hypothetical protein n=1 Tax=Mycolicibacterium sp. S2-37 TaxID=2810297 RepID=UPI001A94D018|nr:hypothetical protein [Mycolicibacterium sp. S2-37]MBO0676753.1 hypothetical protein [Mycolicibacterium sp. S2-37]
MSLYYVKCRGGVDETYAVEADSAEEAKANWFNGMCVNSEAFDVEPASAEISPDECDRDTCRHREHWVLRA